MEVSGQLHASAALDPGKRPLVPPLDRGLGEFQNRSGHCGEEKNFALLGTELRIFSQ
jgi:hypothetical protein